MSILCLYFLSLQFKFSVHPQGCCLTGTRSPEAPMICPQMTKISNKEPTWAPKTYDSFAKFQSTNNKIPCSFCTYCETKNVKRSVVSQGKKYKKVNKQALVLKFASVTSASAVFHCSTVEVFV